MEFCGFTQHGDVDLRLSSWERDQLIQFIDLCQSTRQIDFDSHSPVDFAELRQLRNDLVAHQEGQPLILARLEFFQLFRAASCWYFLGYSGTSDALELEVPREMINWLRAFDEKIPPYIGPMPNER